MNIGHQKQHRMKIMSRYEVPNNALLVLISLILRTTQCQFYLCLYLLTTLTGTSKHKIQIVCTVTQGNLTKLRETTKERIQRIHITGFSFVFFCCFLPQQHRCNIFRVLQILMWGLSVLFTLALEVVSSLPFLSRLFLLAGGSLGYIRGVLCVLYWFQSQPQEYFIFAHLPLFRCVDTGRGKTRISVIQHTFQLLFETLSLCLSHTPIAFTAVS